MTVSLGFDAAIAVAQDIRARTGFLPSLNDPQLKIREVVAWSPADGEGVLEELIRLQDPDEPASRAVVGAALYFLAMDAHELGDATRDTAWHAFSRFAEWQPVSAVSDPHLLRWELHVAATAADLDRVLAIGRRFDEIAPSPEYWSLVAQTVFLLVHPFQQPPFDPGRFDPAIGVFRVEMAELLDLLNYSLALVVEARPGSPWTDPEAFSGRMVNAVITVDALLDRVRRDGTPLPPTQEAIQAWCRFAVGAAARDAARLEEAGVRFEALPEHQAWKRLFDRRQPGPERLRAASTCFVRASSWHAAADVARRWVTFSPDDATAHVRMTEALIALLLFGGEASRSLSVAAELDPEPAANKW